MGGRVFIGTIGWIYDSWRHDFYEGRPAREWLRFCAGRFTAIEINSTHYRLQSIETFRRWREETPPEFRFAVKAHRYLTHNKKLKDPCRPSAWSPAAPRGSGACARTASRSASPMPPTGRFGMP